MRAFIDGSVGDNGLRARALAAEAMEEPAANEVHRQAKGSVATFHPEPATEALMSRSRGHGVRRVRGRHRSSSCLPRR